MKIWNRILHALGLRPATRQFGMDLVTLTTLQELARREQRSEADVAADLITLGLTRQQEYDETMTCWYSLTPREQEIAGLLCLDYKNQEIADHLVISTETVKTHVRHILQKFRVNNRRELQRVLAGWDFSGWQH